jgi:hypothetical protein
MYQPYFQMFGAALVGLLPLAATAQTPTPSASGIEGVISVSPSHGGPVRVDVPNTAPAATTKFVVKKENETVASFTTDAQGAFRISLPPGHYIVAREDAGRIGRWRFEVDVVAGEVKKVQWTADSGMR